MIPGILENWDEIQEEFDLWDKTIDRGFKISVGLLIVGIVSSVLALAFTDLGLLSLIFLLGFGGASVLYQFVINDPEIQAHKDRIDELKK